MFFLSVSRRKLALIATLGAAGCTAPQLETSAVASLEPVRSTVPNKESLAAMFLYGQLREKEGQAPKPPSAPPGAHLVYFGGRIVPNIVVVQVFYGAGSYLPQFTNTASPSVATLYQGVLNSAHVDWLTEYTVGLPSPTSNQAETGWQRVASHQRKSRKRRCCACRRTGRRRGPRRTLLFAELAAMRARTYRGISKAHWSVEHAAQWVQQYVVIALADHGVACPLVFPPELRSIDGTRVRRPGASAQQRRIARGQLRRALRRGHRAANHPRARQPAREPRADIARWCYECGLLSALDSPIGLAWQLYSVDVRSNRRCTMPRCAASHRRARSVRVVEPDAQQHLVLFLAASPHGCARLQLDDECAGVERELGMTAARERFDVRSKWAVTVDEMMRHLTTLKPEIIHFAGHGGGPSAPSARCRRRSMAHRRVNATIVPGIYLENEQRQSQHVNALALAEIIKTTAASVRLIVLNACYSDSLAETLCGVVDCVVGMRGAIDDESARTFAVSFHRALGNRCSVAQAVAQASATLAAKGLLGEQLPVCRTRAGVDADRIVFAR